MIFNKRIPGIVKLLLYISVFLALLQGVLVYTNISFTSDKARNVLLHQIKTITQRDVVIVGDVRISVSLLPELVVDRIHIKNKEGFARENFITALEIASSKNKKGNPIIPEVCIFFNHHLMRGNRSQKVQSSRFNAFRSENHPVLAEAGIEIRYNTRFILPRAKKGSLLPKVYWFRGVAIQRIFPGITKEAVESVLDNPNIKGVVLETFGAGNAMTSPWFIECIAKAVARKVVILNVSQCLGGEVKQGMYSTSVLLQKAGVISGSDITMEAAITKLMFVLGQDLSYKSAIKQMLIPICGELS